ncbi:MAG: helix-hairpin-helix domain-containing protein [Syntrophothermus sp.]
MKILLLFFGCIVSYNLLAQTEVSNLVELAAEKTQEDDLSEQTEGLNWLMEHPVNINNTTEEELGQIIVLSPAQIKSLLKYREDYGKIFTPYELQAVEGFDSTTIQQIQPFIIFGDEPGIHSFSPKALVKYGKNDLFLRFQQVMEKQAGYSDENASASKYSGSPARYYFRYSYNYYDHIAFGLTGEKDPGEEFFGKSQPLGFDYYSGYFTLTTKSFLKKIIIGNFKANFGQGLILGTGSSMGSLPGVAMMRFANGIRPSLSTDENNYLRGIAATLGHKKMTLSLFYSVHKRDANVTGADSATGEIWFSSFGETGYHRLPSEIEDKGRLQERIAGGNLGYRNEFLRLGVTSFYSRWNGILTKDEKLYSKGNFSGNENLNTGMDLKFLFKNIFFFGEGGISLNGGLAYLAGFQVTPDPKVSMAATIRNYDPSYQDLRCNAIGRNTGNSNERGINLFISLLLPCNLTFSGYADVYRFPYLKYGINDPSAGNEFMGTVTFSGLKNFTSLIRIRVMNGEAGLPRDPIDLIINTRKYSFRYQNDWSVSENFMLRTRAEMVATSTGNDPYLYGYLFSQTFHYKTIKRLFSFYMLYAIFDTPGYDQRIYLYENDVLYGYSAPALSGNGIRFSGLITFTPYRHIDLWIRYGITWYSDKSSIGSGSAAIMENTSSEVKLQVRVRF